MNESSFTGVKAALIYKGELLVYLRDDKPGLRFAGLWDFFGGGREEGESPFECLSRELMEELEMTIAPAQVVFTKIFPAMHNPSQDAYFIVVDLTDENVRSMRFGSEGQRCEFVTIDNFMVRSDFIPDLKPPLQSYLDDIK